MYDLNGRKAVMALLTHEKDKTASEILREQNDPSPLKLLIQYMPGMHRYSYYHFLIHIAYKYIY